MFTTLTVDVHFFFKWHNLFNLDSANRNFMQSEPHYTEHIKNAKEAEKEGEMEEAILSYKKAIKQKPLLEQPYTRLMILYRKSKQYDKELKLIDKAIELFADHYDKKKEGYRGSGKIARLSKEILKIIGDKATGNFYPEPVSKWEKRKKVVEKKLS